MRVLPVVEGHGEVSAVPALIRRLYPTLLQVYPDVLRPWRESRGRLASPERLVDIVRAATTMRGIVPADVVLVMFDSDGQCPVELSQPLEAAISVHLRHLSVAVVIAHTAFEAWLLASSGKLVAEGVLVDAPFDASQCEEVPRPKRLVGERMPDSGGYVETMHQVRLSSHIDVEEAAQNSRSFRRLVTALVSHVNGNLLR